MVPPRFPMTDFWLGVIRSLAIITYYPRSQRRLTRLSSERQLHLYYFVSPLEINMSFLPPTQTTNTANREMKDMPARRAKEFFPHKLGEN